MSIEQIPGVPEGWRLVRISRWPKVGEYAIYSPGEVVRVTEPDQWELACIVEEIEQPKQYRPFANAAEFEPHRDRWLNPKFAPDQYIRTTAYIDRGHWVFEEYNTWEKMFANYLFDDGSPFGVEVTE